MVKATRLLADGRIEKNAEKLKTSWSLLEKITHNDPQNATAWFSLGQAGKAIIDMNMGDRSDYLPTIRKAWETTIELEPEHVQALLNLADIHFHYVQGRSGLKDSLSLIERAVELEPENYHARTLLGENLFALGHYDRAQQAFEKVKNAASVEEYLRRRTDEFLGRIYIKRRKYDKAEALLKQSVEGLEGFNAETNEMYGCPYQALGELYSKLDKPDKVIEYAIMAAQAQPDSRDIQLAAVWTCYRQGDYSCSMKFLERAKATDDLNSLLYGGFFGLIRATELIMGIFGYEGKQVDPYKIDGAENAMVKALDAFENDDTAAAGNYLDKGFAIQPEDEFVVVKGFVHLSKKSYDQAREKFTQVLSRNEKEAGAIAGLGHLAIIENDFTVAGKHLNAVFTNLSNEEGRGDDVVLQDRYNWFVYEMTCLGLGWLHANQNQHEKAIEYFSRILGRKPRSLLALLGKGNSLNLLERFDEAEATIRRALEFHPGNRFAITQLGVVQLNSGKLELAEGNFNEAMSKDPNSYTCPYEGLGLVFLRQGNREKAREYLAKAIEINPDIEYKKFNALAKIYIEDRKYEQARELLEKSVENYPYDNEAIELLKKIDSINQ